MMTTHQRLFAVTLLFFSVILLPWWVATALAVVLSTRYVAYEILVAGFLMDAMYGVAQSSFLGIELPFLTGPFVFTLLFGVIFFVSVFAKRSVIFYRGYAR
jgi:hypothetical protein